MRIIMIVGRLMVLTFILSLSFDIILRSWGESHSGFTLDSVDEAFFPSTFAVGIRELGSPNYEIVLHLGGNSGSLYCYFEPSVHHIEGGTAVQVRFRLQAKTVAQHCSLRNGFAPICATSDGHSSE